VLRLSVVLFSRASREMKGYFFFLGRFFDMRMGYLDNDSWGRVTGRGEGMTG
jgi:hypothetical protein